MESSIKTDRTKANSKQSKENVFSTLEWLKQYGVDLIVKSNDYGNSHEIYQGHSIKNGQPCKKEYSYMTQGKTLDDVNARLQTIVCMMQDRYIFESAKVKNDTKHEWKLKELSQ